MDLSLSSRRVGDVVILNCGGRIVVGEEADALQNRIKALLDEGPAFVLNLENVSFIDSSGMGMMVRLLSNARSKGGDLKLCGVGKFVRQTLQLTNLSSIFETHDTEEQAIAAFYRRSRAATTGAEDGLPRILCVDDSVDVLAYLREILRDAGYKPLTTANMHDALVMMRAAKVDLLVLGTKFASDSNRAAFAKANASVPWIALDHEFSRQEAAEAGQKIVQEIRSRLDAPARS
ncbi:MAG: anti-sigma factor antagonist [Acidobacteria bacterium]|nr:anti-sigma factor antagonist [Acidobacteriota bacterium]